MRSTGTLATGSSPCNSEADPLCRPVKAPQLEEGEMPINTYGPKAPYIGKIKSVQKIVGAKATGETYHIVIDTAGKIPFWGERQG